jgi:predicted HicB family RNase H-like nuclease
MQIVDLVCDLCHIGCMAKGNETPQFTFRMKPETRKALEELAEADERSLGNYINRVLDQHVAQHGRVVDLARRRK